MDMNIFIIDNHYEMAAMLGQVLQLEGHQVQLGASGREALNLLEHTLPDVIISDLRMPDGDGLQLIDALRQEPAWRHIPVIMMSGRSRSRRSRKL
jgi:CheY-like chemotaxis protein